MALADLKILKCKTCGEPLDLNTAQGGVIKCAICDSVFTLPKEEAPQKVLDYLFQAEGDLDTGRFDEAYTKYSKAAELDKTEPEAYWGMALAEFKIQYLKDEVNNRLQPICHEVNDKDFADSSNFLKALRYATEAQRAEYERKSEEINYIKNEFNKIAKTGVKYDCFICVKVTDENGGRTQDYKHADDIYFELKGKGYRPFFSERELGGVTGADYEARILYALKSAECMLVVCFDEAYLRTKWVKNEYTRFLKLVNDEEKESDSIALVFGNRPIEKLPGKKGKIQGIALNSLTAMERIVAFVDGHTPEARKRREEQAVAKDKENEDLRNQLAELKKMFLNQQESKASALEAELKKKNEELEQKNAENGLLNSVIGLQNTVNEVTAPKPAPASNGAPITAESNAADFEIENGVLKKYKGNALTVTIPAGVETIGDEAFKGCDGVQSVIIPEGVTVIGERPFARLDNLKSVSIPDSVEKVGGSAFDYCKALNYNEYNGCLYLGNASNPYHLLAKSTDRVGSVYNVHPNTKIIKKYAFFSLRNLEQVILPNGLITIGDSAFESSNKLRSAEIPATVKYIGERAFRSCWGITGVNIPQSVTYIGKDAFTKIISSDKPQLPVTVKGQTTIVKSDLEWESLFAGLTPKPAEAAAVSNASEFEIENGELKKYNGSAKVVIVPNGVTVIGINAFANNGTVEQVVLPNGVTKIEEWAFMGCIRLKGINIPDGVTKIGGSAFSGCISLESLIVPQSVTFLGLFPFRECTGLKTLTLPTKFLNEDLVFNDSTKNCKVTYKNVSAASAPAVSAPAPKPAPAPAPTAKPAPAPKPASKANTDFDISSGGRLFKYKGKDTEVVIPDDVIQIGSLAFLGSKVKSVIIPNSVRLIDHDAFACCWDLKSIVIPKGVECVYEHAFVKCPKLTTIYCEAERQPARWASSWNKKEDKLFSGRHNVVWGYKGK